VGIQRPDFAEFYRETKDECLFAPAASHPAASHPVSRPGVRLAAWTVTRQPDGSIKVSFFRQLRDPVTLQATLRADGVPVSVTFIGQQNPACQPYPSNGSPAFWPFGSKAGPLGRPNPKDFYNTQNALVIHPAALPSGAGLQIAVMRGALRRDRCEPPPQALGTPA